MKFSIKSFDEIFVATVLTACGIETDKYSGNLYYDYYVLQQYLPLAVLKLYFTPPFLPLTNFVATVLTACGIETVECVDYITYFTIVATVLTACGIETLEHHNPCRHKTVATVLTACGIETILYASLFTFN